MIKVGLTGGIGSGKSEVARLLAERGAVVVDADTLAREALVAGSPGPAAVVKEFGPGVLADDGSLDRARLGADARARMAAQVSGAERLATADVVVDNNGNLTELGVQVDRLWARLAERGC